MENKLGHPRKKASFFSWVPQFVFHCWKMFGLFSIFSIFSISFFHLSNSLENCWFFHFFENIQKIESLFCFPKRKHSGKETNNQLHDFYTTSTMSAPNNISDAMEPLIIGLKTEVSRQVGLKRYVIDELGITLSYLIDCWKIIPMPEEQIWEYVLRTKVYIKTLSSSVGLYTYIEKYILKGGKVIDAHFTQNGKYFGPVSKLGSEPVAYEGFFKLNRNQFQIDISNIQNLKFSNGTVNWEIIFKPTQKIETIPIPIAIPIDEIFSELTSELLAEIVSETFAEHPKKITIKVKKPIKKISGN